MNIDKLKFPSRAIKARRPKDPMEPAFAIGTKMTFVPGQLLLTSKGHVDLVRFLRYDGRDRHDHSHIPIIEHVDPQDVGRLLPWESMGPDGKYAPAKEPAIYQTWAGELKEATRPRALGHAAVLRHRAAECLQEAAYWEAVAKALPNIPHNENNHTPNEAKAHRRR